MDQQTQVEVEAQTMNLRGASWAMSDGNGKIVGSVARENVSGRILGEGMERRWQF